VFNPRAILAMRATGGYVAPSGIGSLQESGTIRAMDDDSAARELLADKLRLALVMSSEGFEMKREQFRRRFPAADDDEIDRRLRAWLQERPGAEYGDGVGRPVSWPRTRR
jgi:hypothetical protein